MDFALTQEQQAIVDLTSRILSDRCTQDRLRQVEAGAEWFDRELWAELARADLLGIALPESAGGGGFGFLEACLVLAEQGRAVAPLPLLATVVMGALPMGELGTPEQRARWLPGVVAGTTVLTAALSEADGVDARHPTTRAEPTDGGWLLTGAKTTVPAAHIAEAMLVPAVTSDGEVVVLIVESDAAGLTCSRQDSFSHEPTFRVELGDVEVGRDALLGGPDANGRDQLDWMIDRTVVGLCAVASGVADAGMRLTAAYASERKQFDRPIGSFQAVGHRLADCFVDNQVIRLSMLFAASQLAEGGPADKAVSVAKYWSSYGGSRVGHAGLHVHGGISIDVDYPIHRYFLWAKQIEHTLGAASPHLARIGRLLAAETTPV